LDRYEAKLESSGRFQCRHSLSSFIDYSCKERVKIHIFSP